MMYADFLLYGPELFPTSVRTQGFAQCTLWAKISGALSPFVLQVGRQMWYLNYCVILFAVLVTVGCFILLPETNGHPLPHRTSDVPYIFTDPDRNLKIGMKIKNKIFDLPELHTL